LCEGRTPGDLPLWFMTQSTRLLAHVNGLKRYLASFDKDFVRSNDDFFLRHFLHSIFSHCRLQSQQYIPKSRLQTDCTKISVDQYLSWKKTKISFYESNLRAEIKLGKTSKRAISKLNYHEKIIIFDSYILNDPPIKIIWILL
jgi:hypothetical protein